MYRKVRDKDAPTQSFSYDLVRAVRINGKPCHKFVLGFGSPVSRWSKSTIGFWTRVLARTEKHGFTKDQQFQIADQLRRKGIPLPSVKECKAAKAKTIEWNKSEAAKAEQDKSYPAARFTFFTRTVRCIDRIHQAHSLTISAKPVGAWGCVAAIFGATSVYLIKACDASL
jgi:hypothetical protein